MSASCYHDGTAQLLLRHLDEEAKRQRRAQRRGEDFDRLTYATVEILTLDPLPCWIGLPDALYRQRIASLLSQTEEKARAEQEGKGREPLGRAVILSQDPHSKPIRSKKSPAPRFHAFRKSVRQELSEASSWFLAAFRTASEKLRSGDLAACLASSAAHLRS